ncbi:MAG: UDP-glucose/GDP-mannose dehydrogenase family protein [Deltaproteobacteria bacterium]|nr:UDP-glucose/GDP-mannose dehydrogenase family protein [Deltaproteobacteria bacterium]
MAAGGALVIVCVQGLWHLGSVTAACLAAAGHDVIALDHDPQTIAQLREGRAPVAEPGLDALLREHAARLRFTSDPHDARDAAVVWVTYDTPVDSDDRADVEFVLAQVQRVLPHVSREAVVLVSSQLPVGSSRRIEAMVRELRGSDSAISVACSPENLRLGKAIEVFTHPDRVIVGARDEKARTTIAALLAPITTKIEWMSVESAEMTKHAINSFLALSVTFANELASICEAVGADAKQVERGLKTESRIGPRAYVAPGGAFAGGTLARDVAFLTELGARHHLTLPLLGGVRPSNEAHKQWAVRRIAQRLGRLDGVVVAVWGLTYKPGTDTLRRSASVELCRELAARGARVRAWDPAVRELPAELAATIELAGSPAAAVAGASALVVATEWPELKALDHAALLATMARPLILDANRFLSTIASQPGIEYLAVGVPDHA